MTPVDATRAVADWSHLPLTLTWTWSATATATATATVSASASPPASPRPAAPRRRGRLRRRLRPPASPRPSSPRRPWRRLPPPPPPQTSPQTTACGSGSGAAAAHHRHRPRRRPGARDLAAQSPEVAHLLDRQPVVEPLTPAMQLVVRPLGPDPRLRLRQRERPLLIPVERDVPLLLERRRRLARTAAGAGAGAAAAADAHPRRGRTFAAARAHSRGLVHSLANRDHRRAVLAADLEDLAADALVGDRVPGLAAVAEELHERRGPRANEHGEGSNILILQELFTDCKGYRHPSMGS